MELKWLRGVALLPLRRQLAVLAALLTAALVAALWLAWAEYREAHFGDGHVAAAAELRMLSQRLAKSALRGLRGDAEAFPQIQASRDGFEAALSRLARDARAPRSLEALLADWVRVEKNAATLLRDQKLLVALAAAAERMERDNLQLLEHAERVQNLKLARGAAAAEVAAASRLVMLSQRLVRGAQHLVAADRVEPEVEFLLGKDANEFRATLARLRATARDEETTRALEALAARFAPTQDAVVAVLGTRERLSGAKAAAFALHADSERLLEAVDRVVAEARSAPARLANQAALGLAGLALIALLLLLALLYLVDERRSREAAARRLAVMRRHHERDLQAVEELRRDLQALTAGDLTVRAAVGSEITYPAAAAFNDALDSLRGLLARVGHAAERLGGAAGTAQEAADGLLEAARRQSERTKDASARALGMARAVTELSTRSNRAAELAHGSLTAAVQGRQAVHAALSVVADMGRRVRLAVAGVERGRVPDPDKLAGLLTQIATQAEALGGSASGRTLSALGERLRELADNIGEVSRTAQAQGAAASAIATGVRETLSGAEQAASAALRAAAAVEEVAGLLRELQDALEKLRY
ncbi:MAG: methyl-accepting chemotaxis protein [Betaproteobacteria bacterium]|nr:methyl-accepting chemotaxis protein [Betaproteobacteria bacterium]MDH5221031.1 methyl-accepting chemotaxis protein [Betaproteobacteria bacterium]MDH5349406.1 methyl-accepting chemotaxis protein [Betaproteobacteria bacterium]